MFHITALLISVDIKLLSCSWLMHFLFLFFQKFSLALTLALEIDSDEFEKRKKESLKVVCDFFFNISALNMNS